MVKLAYFDVAPVAFRDGKALNLLAVHVKRRPQKQGVMDRLDEKTVDVTPEPAPLPLDHE
jgi:hypothetical protein